jgi:ABC-type uncharacterized transport system substrate-binding protein
VIQAAAEPLGTEIRSINMKDAGEIEAGIANFARVPNSGLILTGSGPAVRYRDLIKLATKHKLPTIYYDAFFVSGLISYGADRLDQYRRAAGYVDRILKGEKPAEMPVQAPTKYRLVINLKAASAIGITMPPALLARADDVIE